MSEPMSGMRDAVDLAARALWELVHYRAAPDEWLTWLRVYGHDSKYHQHAQAALTAAHVPEMLAVVDAAREERKANDAHRRALRFWQARRNGDAALALSAAIVAAEKAHDSLAAALANLPSDEGVGGDGA